MKQIERARWDLGVDEDFNRADKQKTQPADFVVLVLLLVTLGAMLLHG